MDKLTSELGKLAEEAGIKTWTVVMIDGNQTAHLTGSGCWCAMCVFNLVSAIHAAAEVSNQPKEQMQRVH
ncbi:hypothetical protein ACFSZS_03530 [Seohaeicola zhoushanensis]